MAERIDSGLGGPTDAPGTTEGALRRPDCPGCGEPWLRPAQLPGRFVCVYCLQRFELVSRDGEPLSGSPVRLDTMLVGPGETWDAAFTADDPGVWMIHCHVLVHAARRRDLRARPREAT